MKMFAKITRPAGIVALLLTVQAFGSSLPSSLTYSGSTAGQPTWNRPLAGTPPTGPLSIFGTDVPFFAQTFFADQTGTYSFLSTATSPAKWDNYSFLYAGTFNPNDQFSNILLGNDDDFDLGLGSSGFTYDLTAHISYVFVITGFENGDFGSFTNTISGPGNVQSGEVRVPEAGSILPIFGIVLVGLGICHLRKSRSKAILA